MAEKKLAPPSDAEPDSDGLDDYQLVKESLASSLARRLQGLTHTEARVTSLGHVQRGGVPTAADRLLEPHLQARDSSDPR